MSLRQRGSVFHLDVTYRGKRIRRTTGKTNKYLAELQANDDLQKVRDNGGVDILLRKAPTLEEFAVEFLKYVEESQSLAEDSKIGYAKGWRWLKDTKLAQMKMDAITNHHCEVIKFPGTTNSCANVALRTLRRMFHIAKEMKKLYGDIPKIKERPEWPRSIEMSEDDAIRIDAHWSREPRSQDTRDAFRIIRAAGMRPKECFAMRWEFVRFDLLLYQNPKGKTKASRRQVALNFPPFDCIAILKARHEAQGCPAEGWVFPSPGAKQGHLTTIQKPFFRARNLAGLPRKMVLYTARHGAATAVAEVATLKESMALMGHSDVKTAMIYQHPKNKQIGERLWDRMRTNGTVQ